MQLQERFDETFRVYKARLGATFSFFDIGRSEELMRKAIPLMEQALEGDRGPVTNADIGFELPDGAIS